MKSNSFRCPICKGHLIAREQKQTGTQEGLSAKKLYCPSCEMLVEPVAQATADTNSKPPVPEKPSQNPGRTRQGGTNAGGSQRGDYSDEGATQWLSDPKETERNTWSDKD